MNKLAERDKKIKKLRQELALCNEFIQEKTIEVKHNSNDNHHLLYVAEEYSRHNASISSQKKDQKDALKKITKYITTESNRLDESDPIHAHSLFILKKIKRDILNI